MDEDREVTNTIKHNFFIIFILNVVLISKLYSIYFQMCVAVFFLAVKPFNQVFSRPMAFSNK